MPKGKPKKDNPALYGGSPEPSEPSTTRYAAVHRRGGTHKVRDEHKTDSKYDNYNYKELVDQAKERGIYRKDMKKVEMAWALKHDDEEERRAEQDAVLALQRKRQEAKEEEERRAAHKQRQTEEKHERRIEKERRIQRDESVSDDTLSDADIEAQEISRNEYAREQFGHALSDESWNSTSTESSPEPPMDRDTKPDCRLRLFEWPHEQLPDTHPPRFFSFSSPKPRAIPYAPLRLTTTSSKQKLVLPGSKYPTGVDPDFCPLLSPRTRSAARNGHLIGTLRHAVVESGVDWAQRTLVQGWNAHMYFHLGSRHHNESKPGLADTYRKWGLEKRKLLRVKGKGEARKEERAARHVQRRRNRTRLVQEVYESKITHWKTFAANLPTLWPSGNIPDVPPVESRPGACLALKIATIDVSGAGGKTIFSPLMGGEAWTGNDDKLWEVVEVVEVVEGDGDREDEGNETGDESDEFGGDDKDEEEADGELEEIGCGNEDEALYRRGSMVFTHDNMSTDPVIAWLDKVSPTFAPSTTLMNASNISDMLEADIGLDEWEERYLQE
ncbi:unnamed protein product [Alternaria alternata]